MPTLNKQSLIDSLQQDVRNILDATQSLQQLANHVLLQQPAAGSWSIAQVLEHLNAYNRFYNKALGAALRNNTRAGRDVFKTGWLGYYFTNLMKPGKNGTIAKKMSAPAGYNFGPELDVEKVIKEFVAGQQELLVLLDKARKADLERVRVPISLTRLIKLKMGDVFCFLVAHQQRHFIQIRNVQRAIAQKQAA